MIKVEIFEGSPVYQGLGWAPVATPAKAEGIGSIALDADVRDQQQLAMNGAKALLSLWRHHLHGDVDPDRIRRTVLTQFRLWKGVSNATMA